MWHLRQVVKTPASHAGFMGSNPIGVTRKLQARIYILAFLYCPLPLFDISLQPSIMDGNTLPI